MSTTATSISSRRERSTCTPSAQAVSSPISSSRIRRTSRALPTSINRISGADGQVLPHVRPLSDPAFHRPAERAVSSEARSSSQVLNATSMARTPMPIMIRRKVSIPLRQASSQTTSEVSTPPAIAARAIAVRFWPKRTIATSTPLQAPVLKPITSGLPSGLRVSDWKMAPLTPSAAPMSSAINTRGSRHSFTTIATLRGASPNSAENTWSIVRGTGPCASPSREISRLAAISSRQLAIRRRDGAITGHLPAAGGAPARSAPARRERRSPPIPAVRRAPAGGQSRRQTAAGPGWRAG